MRRRERRAEGDSAREPVPDGPAHGRGGRGGGEAPRREGRQERGVHRHGRHRRGDGALDRGGVRVRGGVKYSPSPKKSSTFCKKMSEELGFPHYACATAEDAVRAADVVFTQTPGGEWVLEEEWLRPHALIVCSGSDQPTKNEIPPAILAGSKVVTDITAQCARVGEVRSAIEAGRDDRRRRARRARADHLRRQGGPRRRRAHRVRPDRHGRAGRRHRIARPSWTRSQVCASRGSGAFKFDADKPRLPAPKLYDYDTIKAKVGPSKALTEAVGRARSSPEARWTCRCPCTSARRPQPPPRRLLHVKGGYIEGAPTWTVKLACVSFYKNAEKGSARGVGCVCGVRA